MWSLLSCNTHRSIVFRQQIAGRVGIFPGQIYCNSTKSSSSSQCSTHVFDEELRKVFMVVQTFLQLSYKKTDRQRWDVVSSHIQTAQMSSVSQSIPDPTPRWVQLQSLDTSAELTLCASRISGGCSRRRFCLFLSCRQGRPCPRSSS